MVKKKDPYNTPLPFRGVSSWWAAGKTPMQLRSMTGSSKAPVAGGAWEAALAANTASKASKASKAKTESNNKLVSNALLTGKRGGGRKTAAQKSALGSAQPREAWVPGANYKRSKKLGAY